MLLLALNRASTSVILFQLVDYLGFNPVQKDFQHDFARMTDGSVVLTELELESVIISD